MTSVFASFIIYFKSVNRFGPAGNSNFKWKVKRTWEMKRAFKTK